MATNGGPMGNKVKQRTKKHQGSKRSLTISGKLILLLILAIISLISLSILSYVQVTKLQTLQDEVMKDQKKQSEF